MVTSSYGTEGAGGKIPPNSWLVFDVELIDVRWLDCLCVPHQFWSYYLLLNGQWTRWIQEFWCVKRDYRFLFAIVQVHRHHMSQYWVVWCLSCEKNLCFIIEKLKTCWNSAMFPQLKERNDRNFGNLNIVACFLVCTLICLI